MSPNSSNADIEEMERSGCVKCVHWEECRSDALDEQGFSTLDLGINCKGYEERK